MNDRPDSTLVKDLLTNAAIAGICMSAVVLILFFTGKLISIWTISTDVILWGLIVWGIMKMRKSSGGEMRFSRAFTYGLQLSFFSSLFVAVTYYMVLRFLDPSFLENYFTWTEKFMYSIIPTDLPADQLEKLRNQVQSDITLTRESTTIMSYTMGKVINFTLFGGLFSLLAGVILRHRPIPPARTTEFSQHGLNEPEN